ncbi:hypothetical protein C1H46_042503 [Malus baccata]|uniref:Glutathione peroxidase n=1 Tax=Malus baccata TaxID=106549 RepID=A0A540KCM3_MALBA|nr:hypothetical protein C1H46_042503 [Malus baccata]
MNGLITRSIHPDVKGNDVDLILYKGKILLVINVASKCGLTNSNYDELNELYQKYKDQGLHFELVWLIPALRFWHFRATSLVIRNREVTKRLKILSALGSNRSFPFFDKIEVNGDNTAPVYKFLKEGMWGFFGDDIQWNFTKFLVDKEGEASHRYYPATPPLRIEPFDIHFPQRDIKTLLGIA